MNQQELSIVTLLLHASLVVQLVVAALLGVFTCGVLMGPRNERYGDRSGGLLRPGMVFTLEPCIANIGLEENLVITETGCELLVPAASEIILI